MLEQSRRQMQRPMPGPWMPSRCLSTHLTMHIAALSAPLH